MILQVNCVHAVAANESRSYCKLGLYGSAPLYQDCENCSTRTPRNNSPDIVTKFVSLTRSGLSRVLVGRADPIVKFERALSCSNCKHCKFNEESKFHYCAECGCPNNRFTRLDSIGSTENELVFETDDYTKLDYPYLKCPIDAKGFSK